MRNAQTFFFSLQQQETEKKLSDNNNNNRRIPLLFTLSSIYSTNASGAHSQAFLQVKFFLADDFHKK